MKTTIKRFFLILPVMFCMVLGLAVPLSSYAIDFGNSIVPLGYSDSVSNIPSSFDSFSWVYPDFNSFSSSSDFSRYIDSSNPYFFFEFASQNNSALPTLDYTTCQCCFSFGSDLSDYNCTVSGNLLTCTFNSRIMYYRFTSTHAGGGVGRGLNYVYSFTYDLSSREIFVYNANHDVLLHVNGGNVKDIVSNLPELSNNLDVSVEFQPALSGSVDRTITNGSGASGLSQGFNMTVSNNGRVPCQYRMAIFEGTSILAYPSGGIYSDTDNCIYAYLTKQWVMAADISTMRHIYAYETATKQFTSCNWHYLAAGATDEQFFKFSQINFKPNVEYTVIVEAVPNSGGMTSIYFTGNTLARGDGEHAMDSSFEQYILSNDDIEVVHRSTFTIPNLSDVTYNPDDSSNGLIPNSSHEDYARAINTRDAYEKERYANSYNAVQNSSGQVDYTSKNLYDDPNSFWNKTYDPSSYSTLYPNYRTGFNNTPSSVNNLSSSISNFGSFLQSIFSYFPSGVFAIFNLALVMVVIIAIIKVVR